MSEHEQGGQFVNTQRRKVLHFPRWVDSWEIKRQEDGRWKVIGIDSRNSDSHNNESR